MKKWLRAVVCAVLIAVMAISFAACGIFGHYSVSYSTDERTISMDVAKGDTINIPYKPTKEFYTFAGWFDAEEGGEQYVNSAGEGVKGIESHLKLYPQFTPVDITLTLDFPLNVGGISKAVYTVKYDGELPADLPLNVTLDNKTFSGWYTEEGGEGIQIASPSGINAEMNKVNKEIYDIKESTKAFTIYAGFDWNIYQVTLKFGNGLQDEVISVVHNTKLSDLVYTARNNGQGVLTWSKTSDGTAFNGPITEDTTLYATEWAPAIEFETGSGSKLAPIVAPAGTYINELPTPQRERYCFSYWKNSAGELVDSVRMPENGMTLTAVWDNAITFDVNGGSAVDPVSAEAGADIVLPKTERKGYIFAGWYDAYERKFTATTMPDEGVHLKAGWYKTKKTVISFFSSEQKKEMTFDRDFNYTINTSYDFSQLYNIGEPLQVRIKWHADFKTNWVPDAGSMFIRVRFYSEKTAVDTYRLDTATLSPVTTSYKTFDFETSFEAKGTVYMMFTSEYEGSNWGMRYYYVKNFYGDVTYPDTSKVIF